MDLQPAETTLYSLSDAAPHDREERRDGDRLMTLYRVGSLSIGERRELCLIKNISAGGMMVRAFCVIPEGTRLTVELKCGQPIAGAVSWTRDVHLGISFDEPVDVLDILTSSTGADRPRMPRIAIDRSVTVRHGASTYRMRICDISQGGLKVQCGTGLEAGSDVVVTLAGIEPLHGVVRWSANDQMGVNFNGTLALPVLVAWLHEQSGRPDKG